jgi:hypothetical protein
MKFSTLITTGIVKAAQIWANYARLNHVYLSPQSVFQETGGVL